MQEGRTRLADDTLLGLLAHAGLALGLVALASLEGVRVDLMGYLFGDVLAVSWADLALIWGGGAAMLGGLALLWRPLLLVSVHPDIAAADGVAVLPVRLAFMILLAVFVAVAMKVVGVLLITSMLIIPAAAARAVSHTPEGMAWLAALLGGLAVVAGLLASLVWDLPSGPAMVVAATRNLRADARCSAARGADDAVAPPALGAGGDARRVLGPPCPAGMRVVPPRTGRGHPGLPIVPRLAGGGGRAGSFCRVHLHPAMVHPAVIRGAPRRLTLTSTVTSPAASKTRVRG